MKCPKQVYIFVERLVLQLCVNCVILQLSEGQFGIVKQKGVCFNIISDQVNRRLSVMA